MCGRVGGEWLRGLFVWLIDWLVGCLFVSLLDWLFGWLIGGLVGCSFCLFDCLVMSVCV